MDNYDTDCCSFAPSQNRVICSLLNKYTLINSSIPSQILYLVSIQYRLTTQLQFVNFYTHSSSFATNVSIIYELLKLSCILDTLRYAGNHN